MNDSKDNLSEAEIQKFKRFAAIILDDSVLRKLLAQSSDGNRYQMYVSLLPYLSFKPKPYWYFAKRAKKVKKVA